MKCLTYIKDFTLIWLCLTLTSRAETLIQSFDTWPVQTTWNATTNENWILYNGQVRDARAQSTLGTPNSAPACAWLGDADVLPGAYLETPALDSGVQRVEYACCNSGTSAVTQVFQIQITTNNGDGWITCNSATSTTNVWQVFTNIINRADAQALRFLKISDTPAKTNIALGLDDIQIFQPSGVLLYDLKTVPTLPTLLQTVHVQVKAGLTAAITNFALETCYRFDPEGPFVTIPMTNISESLYQTTSPIPAGMGYDGTVEYYVAATFSGPGTSPIYLPENGSNGPAMYMPSNPYTDRSPRQLGPSSQRTPLIISEIMYHPAGGTNGQEYIELFNTEPVDQKIDGWRVEGSIHYVFPSNAVIKARSFIVVALDPPTLQATYPTIEIFGPFEGRLPNSGTGQLQVFNRWNAIMLETSYQTQEPWPIAADGAGHSLVLIRPDYGEDDPRAWGASRYVGGSPGRMEEEDDGTDPLRQVVINEYLANPLTPDTKDFVELYNHGSVPVDMGGCHLGTSPESSPYLFPSNTVILPGSYCVVTETQLGFGLNRKGDAIFLWNPTRSYVMDAIRFQAQPAGIAGGRYPDGATLYGDLQSPTPGAANSPWLIDDVVINEIMFAPISGLDRDEYIELFNKGTQSVNVSYWQIRDGIDFLIPPGTIIDSKGFLVIAKDASWLISHYPQLNTHNTLGNFHGTLSHRGEKLTVTRPLNPVEAFINPVVVDEVFYNGGWGPWCNGGGSSLELIDPRADNRLASNWNSSDESGKAPWTSFEFTGPMDNGAGNASGFQIMHLQSGEFLIDNIEVIRSGASTNNCLVYPDFNPAAGWSMLGNHARSLIVSSNGINNSICLWVKATDQGAMAEDASLSINVNRITSPLSPVPTPPQTLTLRAKGRWIAGWPYFRMGVQGLWFEGGAALTLPPSLGSPGMENSIFRTNAPPAISELTHTPILPATNQAVTITCRVEDPDGIASVQLEYRPDSTAILSTMPMRDDGSGGDQTAGDGIFTASIPGASSASIIAFRVVARDNYNPPATAYAPSESTAKLALIRFGEPKPAGTLGYYTAWMTIQNVNLLSSRSVYNDEPVDMTFVYNDDRAIYCGGIRYRGNSRNFAGYQQAGYTMTLPTSERFLGGNSMSIDIPSRNSSDGTIQQERHAFWVGSSAGIPASYNRFVRCRINGGPLLVRHDYQIPTRDISKSWFQDNDPHIYKANYYSGRDQFGNFFTSDTNHVRKESIYHYILSKGKTNIPDDDYSVVYRTLDALYLADPNRYTDRVSALVSIAGWAGYFAVNAATGQGDSYGQEYPHNMYASFSPGYPSCLFLHDMDAAFNWGASIFPGNVVPQKMFSNPPFRRTYLRVLNDIATGPLMPQNYNPELDGWFNAFKTNGLLPADPSPIKNYHNSQRSVINNTLAPYAAAFAVTTPPIGSVATSNTVEIHGTAPVVAEHITLNGRPCRVRFDNVTTWYMRTGLQPGDNLLHFEAFDRLSNRVAETSLILTGTVPISDLREKIIFSELMYHPPRGLGEYIELYNRGTQSVDMANWRIDGINFTFDQGSIIEPGQYAVVAENLAWYAYLYTNAETVIGVYNGTLANEGEHLRLLQPAGTQSWNVINEVTYGNIAPWPTWADGYGQALQLVDTRQDTRIPGNWATADLNANSQWRFMTLTGTTVDNVRTLTNVELQIYLSQAADVIIDQMCLVTGALAETGQNLLVNGDFESPLAPPWRLVGNHTNTLLVATNYPGSGMQALQIISTGYGKGGQNAVMVKPQSLLKGTTYTLSYWYLPRPSDAMLTVEMTNSTLYLTHSIAPAPPDTAAFTPGTSNSLSRTLPNLPALIINEWVLDNHSYTNIYNECSPWLEIYNAGSSTAQLDTCYLSNDAADLRKWKFPTSAILPPYSWQTIQLDTRTSLGTEWHTGFTPNPTNGTLLLTLGYNHENLALDHLHYGPIGADTAIGCYPDGDPDNRHILHTPTPGAANILTSLVNQVWINEWMANNTSIADPQDAAFSDWFELYNPNDHAVELSGWSLSDAVDNPQPFRIPDGTYIPPKGFLTVWADNDPEQNNAGNDLHTDFKLNKDGDTLYCCAPDGTLVDQVTFSAQTENISSGRWPDGASSIYPLGTPTPGAKNQLEAFTNEPVNLTIVSDHGSPSPATGPHPMDYGTRIDCQMVGSPQAAGAGTRYICTGWTAISNTGVQLTASLDMLENTTLTWLWETQQLLTATTTAGGQITSPTGWITRTASVEMTATPAAYYVFSHWSGNVPAGKTNENPLAFTMDQPYTLTAYFIPMTTSHGTPFEWLSNYYPEFNTNEWAALDESDTDGDGQPTWAEFIAGTDPRDPSSVFKIRHAQLYTNGQLHIEWPVVTGRIYAVLGYSNLLDTEPMITFSNLLPDSDMTNEFDLAQPLFYRLSVYQEP